MGFAARRRDPRRQYVALQGYVAIIAIVYVLVNFAVDILYPSSTRGSAMPEHRLSRRTVDRRRRRRSPAAVGSASTASRRALVEQAQDEALGIVGWIAIVWLVFIVRDRAILAPILPHQPDPSQRLPAPPNAGIVLAGHLLGTDDTGRDVLSPRHLGRAGLAARRDRRRSLFGSIIGGFLGLIAGYYRGRLDTVLSDIFNVFLAFPQLVLALALVSVLRQRSGGVAASATRMLGVDHLRSGSSRSRSSAASRAPSTLAWSQREFVMAARGAGRERTADHVPRGAAERRCRRCSRSRCSASRS